MSTDLPRDRFKADETIFQYGSTGHCAYIIEAGLVEIVGRDGQRLAILGPGELFGEISLLDRLARTATVRALVETTLLRVEHEQVSQLLERTDPVIRHLLTLLLERFRGRNPGPPTSAASRDKAEALGRLTMARDLEHALDHDQLCLEYQPLIACASRQLVGFETLVRWNHPVIGRVMPDEFISLAENTGLIVKLGRWALRRALADWRELRYLCVYRDRIDPFIGVNMSLAELRCPGFVDGIIEELKLSGVRPEELKLEVTETMVISDQALVSEALQRLSAHGVRIVLDDFGTGYASFDYLKILPVSTIKIDKSFVLQMSTAPRNFEIVKSALQLANSLNLGTVAEGVEDEDTLAHLCELGCSLAQGHLFAHPMPAEDIRAWLGDGRRSGLLA